ncbi:MAG: 3-deoxy-D-manno-octulosonic acid transferase [Gammaproteobacteria bacterium]
MAKPDSHSTLSYRLLTWGLFPAALLHTGFTAFKSKSKDYLTQRLGIYESKTNANRVVWCHCASVGEVNTALPLLRSLVERGEHLLVSTNTVTGKQALAKAELSNTQHVFLPLDYNFFAQNLIGVFSPKLYLLFETELWPNILHAITKHNIPIAIINGRISEKTLNAPSLILKNYKSVLSKICKIITSSEQNTNRYLALGAKPETITTLDNLKFASFSATSNPTNECPIDYPFLLCASTHQGEEQAIIKQWKASKVKKLGLVIAIRHPQRSKEVCRILDDEQLAYHLHSSSPNNSTKNEIYIIDTLGQLMPFMKEAQSVFIGGSLVPIGGHNVVEPAQFGRCIFIGPHHDDFKDIVNDLKQCNGITVVNNANQLIKETLRLFNNRKTQEQLGNNAKKYLDRKKQVLKDYQDLIFKLIDDQAR